MGFINKILTRGVRKTLTIGRNKNLYDTVKHHFDIEIVLWEQPFYSANINGRDVIIFVDKNNIKPELFCHELLHLKLKLYNLYIGSAIYRLSMEDELLSEIFDESTWMLWGNLLEHIFMFEEYSDMGYEERYFVGDYDDDKFTKEEEEEFKYDFKSGDIYSLPILRKYITKHAVLRISKNKNQDYTEALRTLEKVDKYLFEVLDANINAFYEMNKKGYVYAGSEYMHVLYNCLSGIRNWGLEKNVVKIEEKPD